MPDLPRRQATGPRAAAAIVIALALGALVAALLLGRPPAGASAGELSPEALEQLKQVREALEKAEDAENTFGQEFKRALRKAEKEKFEFVRDAFGGKFVISGRCNAAVLILMLDAVDVRLQEAILGAGPERGRRLKRAEAAAKRLASFLEECVGGTVRPGNIVEKVRALGARHERGNLSEGDLRKSSKAVARQKRAILGDEQIDGCSARRLYVLIEEVDLLIAGALESTPDDFGPDGRKQADRRRRDAVEKALVSVKALKTSFKKIPCDEANDQPPADAPPSDGAPPGGGGEDGSFDAENRPSWFHPNGFGTPPSYECNKVRTTPPQPGAAVVDRITNPGGTQVTKTATTDANGEATISQEINTPGPYRHDLTVTNQGGVQATDSDVNRVTQAMVGPNGECPAPE